jgi:hypothetical protein
MSNISNKQYNFELNYTPYDFFYSTKRKDLPNENQCKVLEEEHKLNAFKCDDDSNLDKCYKYELCNNNNLVKTMYDKRNNHLTSGESYEDLHTKYNFAILKTLNLSAGIIGTLVFIYHYNK